MKQVVFCKFGGLQTKKTKKKTDKNRKKPKKTSPKFEICCSLRFFGVSRYFFGIFRFLVVYFLSVWISTKNSSHSKIISTMRSWDAKNCLAIPTPNAYKTLQLISYKSYYNQQEPLNQNPLNQSKPAKMEKPKKNPKDQSQIWNLL